GKHFDGTQMSLGDVTAWSKDKYNLFQNEKAKSYVMECAMAVVTAIKHCLSKEEFIQRMDEKGWKVNWSDSRKHITFQNRQGQKVRDSNLSKTFHLNISKEALYDEFNRENERRRNESRTDGIGSEGSEVLWYPTGEEAGIADTDALVRQAKNKNRAAKSVISESRTDRRKSESTTRTVRSTENQSIADAEQRQLAEQRRLDAQKRAREINRRNKRRSEPEL
ncbi:MAG: relaxase/mobilization nuclease domain-containing protein, partial [Lachnospiraceae bacterium]|nr:relaxase/mobilization nuclease domain-containing protein [Lachnospiraceae bacterium]